MQVNLHLLPFLTSFFMNSSHYKSFCRPKKLTSTRRKGKLTKSLLCLHEDGLGMPCMQNEQSQALAKCLPPEYRHVKVVEKLVEVSSQFSALTIIIGIMSKLFFNYLYLSIG